MDYKKKYEEALEWARKVMQGKVGFVLDEVLEKFPELKESEDERNIKSLIDELKCSLRAANCQNDACGGGHEKRIALLEWGIAWLEKQKAIDVLDEEEREFADNVDSYRKEVDAAYQKGYNEGVRVTLEKRGEQKPVGEADGEDYGIDGLWHAITILERTLGTVEGYQSDDGILEHKCAITAVKRLYEQKVLEWSKEDEVRLDEAIQMVEANGTWVRSEDSVKLVSDWLKALKYRYQPQPKKGKQSGSPVEFVDLGLSVLWATCNVGANAPEEYGAYFDWGNVTPHYPDSEGKFGTDLNGKDYQNTLGASLTGDIPANSTYDAARANIGDNWRMPTRAEAKELYDNCIWIWTTINGVKGYMVTSKVEGYVGNSIFLPAAGYAYIGSIGDAGRDGCYWTSSYCGDGLAYNIYFYKGRINPITHDGSYHGFTVRAVQDKN